MTATRPIPELSEKEKVNFWKKIDRNGPKLDTMPDRCWIWTASRGSGGYGQFRIGDKTFKSHRIAFVLAGGVLPEESPFALHRCDNPPCCNVSHLFTGTDADNCRDKETKGRGMHPGGMQNGIARLIDDEVRDIRGKYAAGGFSHRELAREFGIAYSTIGRIIRRETWAHA